MEWERFFAKKLTKWHGQSRLQRLLILMDKSFETLLKEEFARPRAKPRSHGGVRTPLCIDMLSV
jgi:hypothetical protein